MNIAYTAHLLNACVALFDEDAINEFIIEFNHEQSEDVIASTVGPDAVKVTLKSPFTLSGKKKCEMIAAKALEVLLSAEILEEPADKIVARYFRKNEIYKREMGTIFAANYESMSEIFEWVGQTEESLQEDVMELLEETNQELEAIQEVLNDPSAIPELTQGELFSAIEPAIETSEQIQVQAPRDRGSMSLKDLFSGKAQATQISAQPTVEVPSISEDDYDLPSPQVDGPSEDLSYIEEFFDEKDTLAQVDDPSEDPSVDALAFLDELEDASRTDLEAPVTELAPETREILREIVEDALQANRDKIEKLHYLHDRLNKPIKRTRRKTESKLPTRPKSYITTQKATKKKVDRQKTRKVSEPSREALSETWDFGGFSANKDKGSVLQKVKDPIVSKLFNQVLPNLANFLNIENNYTFELRSTNTPSVSVRALPQQQKLIISVPKTGNVDREDLLNQLAVSLDELFFNNEYSYDLDPDTILMELDSFL